MRKSVFMIAGLVSAASFALVGCDVQKTQEGSVDMPNYNVTKTDEGHVQMPKYNVDAPDVNVSSTERQITVPDVDVKAEEKTVTLPKVEITPAPDRDDGPVAKNK
jgi:hypothetical protein